MFEENHWLSLSAYDAILEYISWYLFVWLFCISLLCLLHSLMFSVFKDIQRSVFFAGCALLIRCRLYSVQFWRISKSVISLDWFLWFFPYCFLSFSFLCSDSLRTPLTLFSGALRPAGIRGSIWVFCGGRWRHTHGEKQCCLYCKPVLGIWIRIRRIRGYVFGPPDPHPDPLVRGTDPRIRIRIRT